MHASVTSGSLELAGADGQVTARADGDPDGSLALAAWLAAVPTAAIVLLAMAVLGPPLGGVLFPAHAFHFWSDIPAQVIRPEPTEQARFLIALTAPLLLVALTLALARRPPRIGAVAGARIVAGLQVATLLVLVGCYAIQRIYAFPLSYAHPPHVVYFTLPTLLVAAVVAALIAVAARSPRARAAFAAWTAESRGRRVTATVIALAMVAITVLPAIATDRSIALGNGDVAYHLRFTLDEAMAVLDGRSPLGDFAAQYGSLWPYATAAGMSLFGATLGVFTVLMATLAGLALLALFALLRRVTRSAPTALLLFLPLLATSAYRLHGSVVDRFSLITYFGTMPLRYAGPFVLAWLTARHLDGAWPRRAWPLFLLGGLVAVNNVDFGLAAVGATIAALLWAGGRPTTGAARSLAAQVALGLAGAIALVTVLVLARTGEPPHPWLLVRYARMFAVGGFSMLPVRPVVGLSTIVFLTYVIAIGVATVRALRGEPDRLLTGLLAWSGTFGLGAGSYYVGRSIPEVLTNEFPSWGLAITLLAVVVIRRLAAEPRRRAAPLELACLFALGLLVCSLAQTPAPWSQAQRIARHGAPILAQPPGRDFVASLTRRGEHVVVLMSLGHRMAVDLGLDDVDPYTGSQSIQTEEQLADMTKALRAAGGHKLFLSFGESGSALTQALSRERFHLAAEDQQRGLQMWTTR